MNMVNEVLEPSMCDKSIQGLENVHFSQACSQNFVCVCVASIISEKTETSFTKMGSLPNCLISLQHMLPCWDSLIFLSFFFVMEIQYESGNKSWIFPSSSLSGVVRASCTWSSPSLQMDVMCSERTALPFPPSLRSSISTLHTSYQSEELSICPCCILS